MTVAVLAIQLLNGLASASSLFLVAAGLTLIFGVTRIVNFAHGSFYMLGAYVAYAIGTLLAAHGRTLPEFVVSVVGAALAMALLGALVERLLLRRLYAAPELLQLTATFGVVLIVRDATLALFGPEDLLGPRVPGLAGSVEVLGRAVPQYDFVVMLAGPVVLLVLTWLVARTRFGLLVRATAEHRSLASALGVDEALLATAVFALGAGLAGLAGGLQLPREPANLGMDLAVIADAFVVTVVGGLGSIPGAFIAALLIGITKALCIALGDVTLAGVTVALPKATLVVEFIVMAAVLAVRPHGLFGKSVAPAATTLLPEQRALVRPPGRALGWGLAAVLAAALALGTADDYTRVLGTDILVATLFTASLQFLTGTGGIVSFGHAAYFGVGAYAAALGVRHGLPFAAAMALAPLAAWMAAWVFGGLSVRLSGIYRAMLTLAFAQIVWSIAFQWDRVTGGSNGLVGVWPPGPFASRAVFYYFTLALVALACVAAFALSRTPFGFAVRAARDAPQRAEALGIDVRARQWRAFALAGGFAGLAGGLFAFSKGSISPETLGLGRSIDVLVMLLLGGLNAPFGPLLGAGAFVWLQDALARVTEYWRACVGALIVLLVIAFPNGIGGAYARVRGALRP
ncbi:MAG TPA: ABC transporter permease [Casimicrobiaceae bacterium]|nr:ABC transporter permease [Casimicrobiaceae bacterium]